MTLNEALSEGLQVTGVGLIIVFAVLIILMVVLMLMKTFFYKPEGKKKEINNETTAPAVQQPVAVQSVVDESELIAVLTAAVAACMQTSASKLKIKSYRRIDNSAPEWNRAGVRDVIDSRF